LLNERFFINLERFKIELKFGFISPSVSYVDALVQKAFLVNYFVIGIIWFWLFYMLIDVVVCFWDLHTADFVNGEA